MIKEGLCTFRDFSLSSFGGSADDVKPYISGKKFHYLITDLELLDKQCKQLYRKEKKNNLSQSQDSAVR